MEDQEQQHLVKTIANQYANYYSFSNSTNEQAQLVDNTIENMLARIDEFGAFVETIKTDTDKTEKILIPLLVDKSHQVQQLFPLIDQLQALCNDISKNLNNIDERLNHAEKHLSNVISSTPSSNSISNPLKWVLSNLQQQKEEDDIIQYLNAQQHLYQQQKEQKEPFQHIKTHNTTEFFKCLRNDMQQVASKSNNITIPTTTTSSSSSQSSSSTSS